MENLYLHIENLLVHNDYVVVPGLGGFILQYNSAVLDGAILKAPYKAISFNALMHYADGLLAIEYSRANKVSFREAQLFIENEVASFKLALNASGFCTFGQLGVLRVEAGGNICYEPNLAATFIPDNFLAADLYISQKPAKAIKVKHHKQFNAFKVMRYAAMFALVVGIQLVSTKLSDTKIQNSASIINIDQFAVQQNKQQAKIVRLCLADSSAVDTLKVEQQTTVLKMDDDSLYHVVVASLGTKEAAESFKKELEEKSNNEVRILKPSSLYRVALKSFVNYDEAIRFMEELRAKDEQFASAWVYCKK